METISKIKILDKRSQIAYNEYLKSKKYYQAKRIYNVNIELLKLLKDLQFTCNPKNQELVFFYIFHLEDWFLQFSHKEKNIINIDDEFIFERLDKSFSFPKKFFSLINKV